MIDERLEYVRSRSDIGIIGGATGANAARLVLGDEEHFVTASGDGPEMVVLANAYEVTGGAGDGDLYLTRSLVPASHRRVSVGDVLVPSEGRPTPAVESFPSAINPSGLARRELSETLARDGVYDEPPTLRPALLVVGISAPRHVVGSPEDACLGTLCSIRSGNLSSATLNKAGDATVRIVSRVFDVAAAATESVIAMDAYARRMEVVHGGDWEARTGHDGYSRALSGNILYSLTGFLLNELDGEPVRLARSVMPTLRLRASWAARPDLSRGPATMACGDAARRPTASVRCEDACSRRLFVALACETGGGGDVTVDTEGYASPLPGGEELAAELGGVVATPTDARGLASYVAGPASRGCLTSVLAVSALLGSDAGVTLLASDTGRGGRDSLATDALAAAIRATEAGRDAWADWAAGRIASVIGSVAYADALAKAIPAACADELPGWDVIDPTGDCDLVSCKIDWEGIAGRVRAWWAEREGCDGFATDAEYDGGLVSYDDYDDYDYDRGLWGDEDGRYALYAHGTDDADEARAVNEFVWLCELFGRIRHAWRHLDGFGRRRLLAMYPNLGAILDDSGSLRPLRNGVVACAYEAFCDLATERIGADGDVIAACLPPVVMDDGSVASVIAEAFDTEKVDRGYVARLCCDGDPTGFAWMMRVDDDGRQTTFPSVRDIQDVVFETCIASDDADDGLDGEAARMRDALRGDAGRGGKTDGDDTVDTDVDDAATDGPLPDCPHRIAHSATCGLDFSECDGCDGGRDTADGDDDESDFGPDLPALHERRLDRMMANIRTYEGDEGRPAGHRARESRAGRVSDRLNHGRWESPTTADADGSDD